MRDAFRTPGKRSKNCRQETRDRQKALRSAVTRRLPFAPEPLENRTLLSTFVLTSTDDTYVRPGATNGSLNFNQATGSCALPLAGNSCLVVRNDNGTNTGATTRLTYLKFNANGLAGNVNSASLRLYGLVASGTETFPGDKFDDLYGVSGTDWLETNLTYNNRPLPDGGALTSQKISGSTLTPYIWNAAGWVPGRLGGPIAFMLQGANQSSLSHLYRPHEWTTDAERPKLIMSIGVPDSPNGVTATAGNGQITLNWSKIELDGQDVDTSNWSIYRGNTSGSEVLIGTSNTNTYTDTTVSNGTDYFYYVVANNASGDSTPSNEVGPVRPLVTPAPAPSPITVTEGIGTITLSWDPVPFADSYKVYRSDTSGGNFVLQPAQAGTSFTDNVAPGSKFYYKISSVNSAGEGPLSPEIATTAGIIGSGTGISGTYYDNIDFTGAQLARVDATVDFNFDNCCGGSPDPTIGVDTFSARWLGDVQAVYTQPYTFYTRSDDGARLWINDQLVVDHWVDQGATTWASAPINLVAGQKYHVRMDFYENGGAASAQLSWSSPSTVQEVIPTTQLYVYDGLPRLPAAPAGVTANTIDSTDVCVLWNDVSYDEDNFVLQRATKSDFSDAVNVTLAQTPNIGSCQDSGVTGGITYYYRVKSHNTVGDSAYIVANQRALAGLTRASNVTTVTTAVAHGLAVGSVVAISGVTPSSFNGTFTITSVPTPTTFTVANTGTPVAATAFANYVAAVIPSGTPGPITFNPFPATTTDLVLVDGGDPGTPPPSFVGGRLRLTDPINGAAGAAWTTNVKLINSFTSSFDFQVTQSNGADGFVFAIQANGNNVIGGAGGGLGYAGIGRSVAIKIDFYPAINQTGVYVNGAMNDTVGTALNQAQDLGGFGSLGFNFGGGTIYHVDIAYDGANLVYTVSNPLTRTQTASLHYAVDIAGTIGSQCAYIGFTGANGGLHAQQEILNWTFSSGAPVVNGTTADDTFYVRQNAPGGNRVHVWKNRDPVANPIPDIDVAKADITNLALSGGRGNDIFTIDYVNGNPLPAGGLLMDGGQGVDKLFVKGTSAGETFSINGTQVTAPGGSFKYQFIDGASFDLGSNGGGDGDDNLNVTAAVPFTPVLNGGGGNNTVTYSDGTYALTADSRVGNNDGAGNDTLNIIASGTTTISSSSAQHLKALTLNGTSSFTLSPGAGLLRTKGLVIASGAALDVNDADVIVQSNAASKQADWNNLMNQVRSGRNGGRWNGVGIRSTTAANNPSHATAVGIILNDNGSGGTILSSFNGEPVDANTVLLKYTYYGDRDFDGDVDADDYAGMDTGFANRNSPGALTFPHQPWRDGDPNLSGSVNSDDYFAIDNAFSNQPTVLAAPAEPMAASSTTVSKTAAKAKVKHKHHKSAAPQRVLMFRVRD